jgi:hypothetical protein
MAFSGSFSFRKQKAKELLREKSDIKLLPLYKKVDNIGKTMFS